MATRDSTREPTYWVIFAGVMMLLLGFLNSSTASRRW